MKTIRGRLDAAIRHLLSLFQFETLDSELKAVIQWVNLARVMIFFGALLRFSLLVGHYERPIWFIIGEGLALGLFLIYLGIVQYYIWMKPQQATLEWFRKLQVYADWLFTSALYLLSLDVGSDLFLTLALPLLLGAGRLSNWPRLRPLLLCSLYFVGDPDLFDAAGVVFDGFGSLVGEVA